MKALILNITITATITNPSEGSGYAAWEYINNFLKTNGSIYSLNGEFEDFDELPTQELEVTVIVQDPTETAEAEFKTFIENKLKTTGWDYTVGIESQSPVDGDGGFKAEFSDFRAKENWVDGTVSNNDVEYKFQIKLFDEPSEYGYKGGRCSKISIWPSTGDFGDCIVHFDRNFWDVLPQFAQEVQALECAVALCEASPKRFENNSS